MSFRFMAWGFWNKEAHDNRVFDAFEYLRSILDSDSMISIQLFNGANIYGGLYSLKYVLNYHTFNFNEVECKISDIDILRVDEPHFKTKNCKNNKNLIDKTYQSRLI